MYLSVPFIAEGKAVTLSYQGCADAGLCYPVQTKQFQLADATFVGDTPDEGAAIRNNPNNNR